MLENEIIRKIEVFLRIFRASNFSKKNEISETEKTLVDVCNTSELFDKLQNDIKLTEELIDGLKIDSKNFEKNEIFLKKIFENISPEATLSRF